MFKRAIKYIVCFMCVFCITILCSITVFAYPSEKEIQKRTGDGGTPTGVGLATWALSGYIEGWTYIWGGVEINSCDCSGLIVAYHGVSSYSRTDLLGAAQGANKAWGYVSSGIPRIHGLGLHKPSHVGVYVGSNATATKKSGTSGYHQGVEKTGNTIDQNDGLPPDGCGSCMLLRDISADSWVEWYQVDGVNYPEKGFVKFNGQVFYYEKTSGKSYSEYVVDCERTVNGKKYTFDKNGVCKQNVPDNLLAQTTYLKSSGGSQSNSNDNSENTDSSDVSKSTSESSHSYKYSDFSDASVEEVSRTSADRELTFEDERRIDDLNYRINNHRESEVWNTLYVIVQFIGILFLVYTILLVLVYYIDIFNSLTEVSLLHKLTFGKMYPVGSARNIENLALNNDEKGIIYATHKTIWITFVIGVLASAVLINARTIVIDFIYLSSWFENLIKSATGG